jgi:hypothetical protein
MNPTTLPDLLTPLDVALWLSLPTREVERMARRGQVPCVELPSGDLMFERTALVGWLESLRRTEEVARAS